MRRRCVVPFRVSLLTLVSALLTAAFARAGEAPPGATVMTVTVNTGRLSVSAHDAPLGDILTLIGQQARMNVHLDGQFRTPITTTFTDVPLEAGIRRLTRGHSSGFVYESASPSGQAARLAEIWIIESSPTVAPLAPTDLRMRAARFARMASLGWRGDDSAITELSRILAEDPDPAVRSRAVLTVSRLRNARARSALIAALADQQPRVRIQALRGLQRADGEAAADAVRQVLVTDPEASVRRAAAWTLATLRTAAAGPALRVAMSADGDASVRQAAAAAFQRWEQLAEPPPGR
jgi:HEAT repeat protein